MLPPTCFAPRSAPTLRPLGVRFQEEATGACFEGVSQQRIGIVHGKDQDFGFRDAIANLACRLDPVEQGQFVAALQMSQLGSFTSV
jgi:hypothetical protein